MAPAVARELSLPLIAKDTIKDALMSVLPVRDVETSRQIGQGAVAAMLAVAAESPVGAVIESNFYRSVAVDALRRLPGRSLRSVRGTSTCYNQHPTSRRDFGTR